MNNTYGLPSDPFCGDDKLVRNVRAQLTDAQTGSTFLLTDEGLYVVRRPDDEWIKRFRDQTYEN